MALPVASEINQGGTTVQKATFKGKPLRLDFKQGQVTPEGARFVAETEWYEITLIHAKQTDVYILQALPKNGHDGPIFTSGTIRATTATDAMEMAPAYIMDWIAGNMRTWAELNVHMVTNMSK